MVLAQEILAAPELIDGLISSIDALAGALKATGIVIIAWLGFSVYRFWITKREYSMLKNINRDLGKIKKRLKIR